MKNSWCPVTQLVAQLREPFWVQPERILVSIVWRNQCFLKQTDEFFKSSIVKTDIDDIKNIDTTKKPCYFFKYFYNEVLTYQVNYDFHFPIRDVISLQKANKKVKNLKWNHRGVIAKHRTRHVGNDASFRIEPDFTR